MYRPAPTLTVDNARVALDAGLRAIAAGQTHIDLGDMVTVDSSAVATLLAWQRAARNSGVALVFDNVPSNLQSLISLYDVSDLLHVAAAGLSRADLPHH